MTELTTAQVIDTIVELGTILDAQSVAKPRYILVPYRFVRDCLDMLSYRRDRYPRRRGARGRKRSITESRFYTHTRTSC